MSKLNEIILGKTDESNFNSPYKTRSNNDEGVLRDNSTPISNLYLLQKRK